MGEQSDVKTGFDSVNQKDLWQCRTKEIYQPCLSSLLQHN